MQNNGGAQNTLQRYLQILLGTISEEDFEDVQEYIRERITDQVEESEDMEEEEEEEEEEDYGGESEDHQQSFINTSTTSNIPGKDNKQHKESPLLNEAISMELLSRTGCSVNKPNKAIHTMLNARELCMNGMRSSARIHITQRMIPKFLCTNIADYSHQAFCGKFSKNGSIFVTAAQDCKIRFYDTSSWKLEKQIKARDISWSVIDTDFSPDQRWLIYSSWSDYVQLCNVQGEEERHEALDMKPDGHRFCLFSINFAPDSREILGGSSDRCLYIYDLDRRERTLQVCGHDNDINTVKFADESAQVLISGSDDTLIKLWDRRTLSASNPMPVGLLVGHSQGITHIDSKGDGRYFISNGKDQCIKLWDIRKMSNKPGKASGRTIVDYRHAMNHSRLRRMSIEEDQSLMTYTGHRILQTLIRCYFSPAQSTGQRYIYTGSADSQVHSKTVGKLGGHRAVIRDVSWHPTDPVLLSTAWDGTIRMWENKSNEEKKEQWK